MLGRNPLRLSGPSLDWSKAEENCEYWRSYGTSIGVIVRSRKDLQERRVRDTAANCDIMSRTAAGPFRGNVSREHIPILVILIIKDLRLSRIASP